MSWTSFESGNDKPYMKNWEEYVRRREIMSRLVSWHPPTMLQSLHECLLSGMGEAVNWEYDQRTPLQWSLISSTAEIRGIQKQFLL